jgi:2-oxoglutarate ferredoxin oxidoreductase subunit delta
MAIYIEERLCKGCGVCIHFCKQGVLKLSDKHNLKGYNVVEVVDLGKCKTCKLCEMNCPDLALYVEIEEEKKGKKRKSA